MKLTAEMKTKVERVFRLQTWKNFIERETERDLAHLMSELYPSKLKYCTKANVWFRLKDNQTWEECDTYMICYYFDEVRELVNDYICYYQLQNFVLVKNEETEEDDEEKENKKIKAKVKKELQRLNKLFNLLGYKPFRNNTVSLMRDLLGVPNFAERLDSKTHLFAFNNKVFDMDFGCVRNITDGDYILTTCGYDYKEERVSNDEVLKFFESLFPTKEEADFCLKSLAYMLHGDKSKLDYFFIWYGKGGNGKSTVIELVSRVFGDYYSPIDISYFTGTRTESSSQAKPELANKRGKRIVISTEPESDSKINVSRFKKLSDKIETRKLYSDPIQYKPQFGVILLSNEYPTFTTHDGGLLRRFVGQTFPFKFCDNPTEPNEKKIDINLKNTITSDAFRDATIKLLINIYLKDVRNKASLNPPLSVKTFTKEVNEESDTLGTFLSAYLETTQSQKDKLTTSDIYDKYISKTGSSMYIETLGKELKKRGFEKNKKQTHFIKIKFKQVFDEEEEKDNIIF